MTANRYRDTLSHRGLQPFLWTQFLGAFNDNLFKIVVSMLAVHAVAATQAGRELSIASTIFILPFLLFSGYAGQLADVYSKRTVLVVSKSIEPPTRIRRTKLPRNLIPGSRRGKVGVLAADAKSAEQTWVVGLAEQQRSAGVAGIRGPP